MPYFRIKEDTSPSEYTGDIDAAHKLMRDTLAASRVGRLRQATSLLEDNRAHLADFLTRDARGHHLVDYFNQLARELEQEQASLAQTHATSTLPSAWPRREAGCVCR